MADRESAWRWIDEIGKVIAGKRQVIEQLVLACLCEGHALLEDKPGVGKTTLVQALANSVGCSFKRIQFTPDQLPGDITGVAAVHPQTLEMYYRPGPIMANIVLADEINRASPRTQSALLEAMEERAVTVDNQTHPLPRPFMLLATQNPLRHEGTYPLPEAQLDRFLFRLQVGYPEREQEVELLERVRTDHPIRRVEAVITPAMLLDMQHAVRQIYVDSSIKRYIVGLAEATRAHPDIELGMSPRASISLMRASQAKAWLEGRSFVVPDDVKYSAPPVILHRLAARAAARLNAGDKEGILDSLLRRVPVPATGHEPRGSLLRRGGSRR